MSCGIYIFIDETNNDICFGEKSSRKEKWETLRGSCL
jgi:hypothetical protein